MTANLARTMKPTPNITGTATIQKYVGAPEETVPATTLASFRYWLKKHRGTVLYDPEPCHHGQRDGNWGAYDSTGRYWQTRGGDPSDEMSYIRSCARREIYQAIAHEHGYHLEDC